MGRLPATEFMPSFSGRSLDHGRYNLLEKLGAGAYGKVYRAFDNKSSGRQAYYAVKCLNKPLAGTRADMLQRREFSLHKRVSDHKNVVTFYEFFSDPFYTYVVLDLSLGGDLFSAITEKKIFYKRTPLIKEAFAQLVDAVHFCHERGVFHRDIKPENILCTDDGKHVRLADFGLSIDSEYCSDFGCGSSYYMSPGSSPFVILSLFSHFISECIGQEVVGESYSTRHNDTWALGVILVNMITNRNPWRYATTDDDCFLSYTQDSEFLREVLPISQEVNDLLKLVYTMDANARILLPDFQAKVLELQTLYDDEEPPVVESPASGAVETSHCSVTQVVKPVEEAPVPSAPPVLRSESPVDVSAVEKKLARLHVSPSPRNSLHPSTATSKTSTPSRKSVWSGLTFGGSSGVSEGDSKGPRTPATRSREASVVVVPASGSHTSIPLVDAKAEHVPIVKAKRSKTHLIRAAVQRIRGATFR